MVSSEAWLKMADRSMRAEQGATTRGQMNSHTRNRPTNVLPAPDSAAQWMIAAPPKRRHCIHGPRRPAWVETGNASDRDAMARMRKYQSFADNLPNGKIAGGAASLTTTSYSTFLSVTRKLTPGCIR
jgi:hypothetical protein